MTTTETRRSRGRVLLAATAALATAGILTVTMASSLGPLGAPAAHATQHGADQVNYADIADQMVSTSWLLERAGIGPQTIAIAGVAGTDVESVFQAADGVLASSRANLVAALASALENSDRAESLAESVRRGTADGDSATQLASANQSLAVANAAIEQIAGDLRGSLAASLGATRLSASETARSNIAFGVPPELAAGDFSDAGRMAVRAAVTLERLAIEDGTTVDSEVTSLLAQTRSRSDVASGSNNHASYAAAVRTAWAAAEASRAAAE